MTGDINFPLTGWKSLAAGRLESASFFVHNMLEYFVCATSSTGDGLARNFKAIAAPDRKSIRLFQTGYIQKVEVANRSSLVFYRARCAPEMKTRADYKLRMCVTVSGEKREVAEDVLCDCTCPAGKGPKGSCKHLAALMYALEEFTRLGFTRDLATCTDVLQTWNQPSQKKSKPMKIEEMDWQRPAQSDASKEKRKRTAADIKDPRALSKRGCMQDSVTEHAYSSFTGHGPLLGLSLVAGDEAFQSVKKETRLRKQAEKQAPWLELRTAGVQLSDCDSEADCITPVPSDSEWMEETDEQYEWYGQNVVVSPDAAEAIHQATQTQSNSDRWRDERKKRITASVAHVVAHRRDTTDPSKLVQRIVERPSFTSEATDWGIQHEACGRSTYIATKHKEGRSVTVEPCGLIVSVAEPWLAASPDGRVGDNVLLEIKCPFSCRSVDFFAAASAVSGFCLEVRGKSLRLKRNHAYYTQVQVQMFVAGYPFCDFVVWRPDEVFIETIERDDVFLQSLLPNLRSFYFRFVLPVLASS